MMPILSSPDFRFQRRGNRSTKRLNNLPKVTYLVGSRAGIETHPGSLSVSQVCALHHCARSVSNVKQSVTYHRTVILFRQVHKLPQHWLSRALHHQSTHLGFQNYPPTGNINNLFKRSPIEPRYALSRCELLHKEKK